MAGDVTHYSASHVDELLKCPICLDRYKQPKHLPCQHTVCKTPCLTGLLSNSPRILHCPQCRAMHPVPAGGVNAFPDNIIINNLLDLPTTTAVASKCACDRTDNLSLCSHCNRQICIDCRPRHLSTIRGEVETSVENLRRKIPTVDGKMAECDRQKNAVKTKFSNVKIDIVEQFASAVNRMNERKQALLTELELMESQRLHTLQLRHESLEVDIATAASFCETAARDLSNIASPSGLQAMKEQCDKLLKSLDDIPVLSNEAVDVVFVHDAESLQQVLENYGRVSTVGEAARPARRQWSNNTTTNQRTSNPSTGLSYSLNISPPRNAQRAQSFNSSPRRFDSSSFDLFSQTFPARRSAESVHSNISSFFGPYPDNTRRSTSPPIPTHTPRPQPSPREESFSGFISLENPNFRRRRRTNDSNSRTERQRPNPRRNSHPTNNEPARTQPTSHRAPPILQRQDTFTRHQVDDDDDDIITSATVNSQSRPAAISFQISLDDAPLPPRTPNSLETVRPVNNYGEKRLHKCIDSRRGHDWFQHCTGIAVQPDTDNLFIIDEQSSQVLVFDNNGRHIKIFASAGTNRGQLNNPFDAQFRGDIVYITDTGNNRIQAFNSDGRSIEFIVNYRFNSPHGISSDGAKLFICDSGHGKVCILGDTVSTFHHEQLSTPTHISVSKNRVAVTDPSKHSVFLFSIEGSLLRRFGQQGSAMGDILSPRGIAVDFQGFILLVNSQNYRVDVFRENGTFYCTFGEQGREVGEFSNMCGIAVTVNGRVVVCDGNRVHIF